ncbi:hypothetical protein UA08_06361 [Talaromyces atroroseus]|uniref:Uncharacterized protein n=1 Tax=Talaromyces atroroseus TaxID=1441469 RepID=A0A225ABU2_TALAT|nr:hypothetical protein UA08_06361 [Talaromyces atroroseus]OKL58492.1 hypothetical protein UA08_06361 [Talaromyces atroroseus]
MLSCKEELAYLSGPKEPALLEQTIGQKFAETVSSFQDRTAIKDAFAHLSYRELDQQSDALALGLLDLGIAQGDRVAISLGNSIANAVISYGCFKIGAIVTPLNPAYTPAQVISALDHVSAKCFVLSTEIMLPYKQPKSAAPLLSAVLQGIERSGFVSLLVDNSTNEAHKSEFKATAEYEMLLSSNQGRKLPVQDQLKHCDIASIQFTSGTTSTPKAACLTHRNVLNNGVLVGLGMELTESDIAFNVGAVVRSIKDDQPTVLHGVPTMFLAELELIEKYSINPDEIKHLRTGVIGGSPIPASLRLALHEKLNLSNLTNCYGLTESSPIICQTASTDTLEAKLNTVGRMLPHTSARIVARDDPTRTLKRGEKGELLISGYAVMKGYWKDEKRTSESFIVQEKEDGLKQIWLRTGDEALFRPDGYIQITGRIKDIIIRGGENIYPHEIENVLIQHPMVSNASVVGLPDGKYGEIIAAFVIVKTGIHTVENLEKEENRELKHTTLSQRDIQLWVQDRLPKMLVPRFVFWQERMPLTSSGKIEKYKLRQLGIRLLKYAD